MTYIIFIIGGGIGLLINYSLTSFFLNQDLAFWLSYSLGTLFNIVFNFLYHWFITFGIPIHKIAAFTKFTFLSGSFWVVNIGVTALVDLMFDWNRNIVIFVGVVFMSVGNYLISSTYIFSSTIDPDLTLDRIEKIYSSVADDFYDAQKTTVNPIRSWFHEKRQELIEEAIVEFTENLENPTIIDFGAGNCAWNTGKIPVTAVDMNEQLLDYAQKHDRITKKIVAPIHESGLPSESADIAIISEVVEHLIDPIPALEEIQRVLKKDGKLLVTVPYDTVLSFWKPLFTLQCFLQGTIKRSYYYLNKCGHVNAYSPKTIQELLEPYFRIDKKVSMRRFSIFVFCTKV